MSKDSLLKLRVLLVVAIFAWYTSSVGAQTIPTQLAGNSLSQYPFFEYVKAFNVDATVEVAIDPGRFPSILGKTCDIFVVQHKSAAQWSSDPALTDVSPGGALKQTFVGASIQSNRFQVSAPFELNANAGAGLGVGYDLVVDVDRNGKLSSGDFIDGLQDEAGFYAVHDTTAAGPLSVTETIYSLDPSIGTTFGIPATKLAEDLYYPANIASMGQLPLIVISRGNGHNFRWYRAWLVS